MDTTYKTCKLSLPLFFLVVRTNVGYSVVAEFVVQHEDSVSIAEALGILKNRWDDNSIAIGNFMIDCQQSEENAICGVYPESCIYLCGFHRLQAWLRWLVNTKNGVSVHKDKILSLMRNVADATTEVQYTAALVKLQKSPFWSKSLKLRNYYTQQWAPKKLVRLYSWGRTVYKSLNLTTTFYFSLISRCGCRLIEWVNSSTTTQIMVSKPRTRLSNTHSSTVAAI